LDSHLKSVTHSLVLYRVRLSTSHNTPVFKAYIQFFSLKELQSIEDFIVLDCLYTKSNLLYPTLPLLLLYFLYSNNTCFTLPKMGTSMLKCLENGFRNGLLSFSDFVWTCFAHIVPVKSIIGILRVFPFLLIGIGPVTG